MYDHYGAQVRRQLDELRQQLSAGRATIDGLQREALKGAARLRTAETELAEARSWARHGYEIGQRHCGWTDHGVAPAWLTDGWPPHIDTCQHLTALDAAEAELAELREGEEPYEDERLVPTPGQWIWRWNRATPAERLEIAANRLELLERANRCVNGMHEQRLAERWDDLMAEKQRAEQAEAELAESRRRFADERATAVTRAHETERVRTERDAFAAGIPLICCDERHEAKVRGLEELLVAGQKATAHWEEAYAREVRAHGTTERALSAAEARIAAVRALAERGGIYVDGARRIIANQVLAALDGPAEQPSGPAQLSPASIAAPEPVQLPTWIAMAEMAQRARAAQRVEQHHLEEWLYRKATLAGLDVHWATSGVDEVAGHPQAIDRLMAALAVKRGPVGPLGQVGALMGLSVVADGTLPPGEVHLRPHPHSAEPPAGPCRCGHERAEHADGVCRDCGRAGLSSLHRHPFIACDGPS